jgi:hypothetical protein
MPPVYDDLAVLLEAPMQDVRLAIRALRSTPIVSIVAVLSLALGSGANTAIFSLVNTLLLRTLPVSEPQRLVVISEDRAIRQGFTAGWTYAIWDQIHQRAQPFDGSCSWMSERFNLAQGGGETEPVDGIYASGDYFSTLGVPALIGRTFTPADDVRGGTDGPVAVISYALWQRRFGGSGTIVGTPLFVERVSFTIVGVTPPAFFGAEVGRAFDVALPMNAEPLIRGKDSRIGPDRGFYGLTVLLRLRADQSIEAANAIVRGVQPQIRDAAMPSTLPPLAQKEFMKEAFTLVPAASGTSRLRSRYERPLAAIFVVVAPGDYDGDGKTDIAIFRPSTGTWFILYSSTGTFAGIRWGNAEDVVAPGDYDGDGKTDIAVFRPSTGTWFILYSSTGTFAGIRWGNAEDVVVPADYDGDGKTDIAVFRPSNGVWFAVISSTGTFASVQWGTSGDIPIPAR